MKPMLGNCSFNTDRLSVNNWQSVSRVEREAGGVILSHVTEESRQFLPESMASVRTVDDAVAWLKIQQDEKTYVLFAEHRISKESAAILVASEQSDSGATNIYVGYLVDPNHQGGGIATELVRGFIVWAGSTVNIDSVIAGVDSSNPASKAVLAKSGFVAVTKNDDSADYLMYEHRLDR